MGIYLNNKRLTNSPWLQLQSVKQTLLEKCDEVSDLMDDICFYDEDAITESISNTLTGQSGRIYEFTSSANSSDLTVSYRDVDSESLTYDDSVVSKTFSNFFSISEDERDFDVNLATNKLTLSEILSDINSANKFNFGIVEITRALQGSVSLNYSDLTSILSEYVSIGESEVTTLLSNCRNALQSAKLSAQSWLATISTMFKQASDELEDGSCYLDTSKPFVYQSVISMLIGVATNIVTTVASSLLSIITPILGIIALAVGGIITSIIKLFQSATAPINIDNAAVSDIVKGPVIFASLTNDAIHHIGSEYRWFKHLTKDDGVALIPWGPFQFYGFMPDDTGTRYYNGFLAVQWNWRKVLKHMCDSYYIYVGSYTDSVHASPPQDYTYLRFQVTNNLGNNVLRPYFTDPQYYYTSDELSNIMADYKQVLINLYMSLVLYNLIGRISETDAKTLPAGKYVCTSFPMYSDNFDVSHEYFLQSSPGLYMDSTSMTNDRNFILGFLTHYFRFDGNFSDIDTALQYGVSDATRESYLHQAIINFYNNFVTAYATRGYRIAGLENFGLGSYDNTYPEYNYGKTSSGIITEQLCVDDATLNTELQSICFQVSSTPPDRAIDVNGVTFAQLEAEVILSAAVIAAVTIGAIGIKRYMSNRRILKKTSRANKLNELKKNYSDNPTAENAKAYAKAVKQYNLKGKIFGWGTYDCSNGWFDGPTGTASSSLSSAMMSSDTGGVIPYLMSAISSGEYEGESVNDLSIKSLTELIRGPIV